VKIRVFDRIDPGNIERRERELWLLAIAVIAILAAGVAILMYFRIFAHAFVLTGSFVRTAFFAFCVLATLLIAYLVDRQLVVRHLRQQLTEALERNVALRHQAGADVLAALPGFNDFQDRIAMEFLRAANAREPLSLVVVLILPSAVVSGTKEAVSAFGDAGNALKRRLRQEDSMFLIGSGAFVILLPGISLAKARQSAGRLEEGLLDASGASNRFTSELQVINYPQHYHTVREIEGAVRCLVPEGADAAHSPHPTLI
jgi:GGDEF domain-containing protein